MLLNSIVLQIDPDPIELDQLSFELEQALGHPVGVGLEGTDRLWISPEDVDIELVYDVLENHRPQRHFLYTPEQCDLHDSLVRLVTNQASASDFGPALRAVALLLRNEFPHCDCTEPLTERKT